MVKREHVNLDNFWLKEDTLEDILDLPSPGLLAVEITKNLESALNLFPKIQVELDNSE